MAEKAYKLGFGKDSYINILELVITTTMMGLSEETIKSMLSGIDEDIQSLILGVVGGVIVEKYQDFQLDTMNCAGGVQ